MTKTVFEMYNGDQVTDSIVQEASQLFNENYGIWSKDAATEIGAFAKEGDIAIVDWMQPAKFE